MEELKLKEIIREVIREEINKSMLIEMSISLSDYKRIIDNLIVQIAQNWCLVRYVTLSGNKVELKKHWQSELNTHMNNIARRKLKKGDNIQSKEKALYSVWNENDFDTDEHCIDMAIVTKFEREDIDVFDKHYAQAITDFKNATRDIVSAILSGSRSTIANYIMTI